MGVLCLMCVVRWKHDARVIRTPSGNDVWRNMMLLVSFYVTLAPLSRFFFIFCVPCTIRRQPSVSPTADLPIWAPRTGFRSCGMTRHWAVGFRRFDSTWCHFKGSIVPWTILGRCVLSQKNWSSGIPQLQLRYAYCRTGLIVVIYDSSTHHDVYERNTWPNFSVIRWWLLLHVSRGVSRFCLTL